MRRTRRGSARNREHAQRHPIPTNETLRRAVGPAEVTGAPPSHDASGKSRRDVSGAAVRRRARRRQGVAAEGVGAGRPQKRSCGSSEENRVKWSCARGGTEAVGRPRAADANDPRPRARRRSVPPRRAARRAASLHRRAHLLAASSGCAASLSDLQEMACAPRSVQQAVAEAAVARLCGWIIAAFIRVVMRRPTLVRKETPHVGAAEYYRKRAAQSSAFASRARTMEWLPPHRRLRCKWKGRLGLQPLHRQADDCTP